MSVIHFKEKIKSFMEKPHILDYLEVGIVLLVGIGSFALGRLSVVNNTNSDSVNKGGVVVLSHNEGIQNATLRTFSTTTDIGQGDNSNTNASSEEAFVASRSGKKYYPSNCGSANRIKPENRVYFKTSTEAEARGLTRSETCK
jgi:hypothetical protein